MDDNEFKVNLALRRAQETLFQRFDYVMESTGLSEDQFFRFVQAWFGNDVLDCYREWILEGAE